MVGRLVVRHVQNPFMSTVLLNWREQLLLQLAPTGQSKKSFVTAVGTAIDQGAAAEAVALSAFVLKGAREGQMRVSGQQTASGPALRGVCAGLRPLVHR